ncbi:hypothetical protein SacxiDRAFT_1490 [Saccharomonospora xinjiangensis XJ-54]|uniref:Uncharacterized protein n=2 Tax=Saccharomonospora TaxID=1851 RepID=I0V0T5_9PSEU|nr:hypothetical protein SacxiDRAFT_1490 [Saccharomonospora xinjiangensis XJ-54]
MEIATGAASVAPGGSLVSAVSALKKSMGVESMMEVTRSADRLVASAKSGGFTVTKEAADPLIEVMEEFIDRVNLLDSELVAFDYAPNLGNHDYGKLAAEHLHKSANGDGSARLALKQLRVILERSRDALRIASGRYQEQEEEARDSLSRD